MDLNKQSSNTKSNNTNVTIKTNTKFKAKNHTISRATYWTHEEEFSGTTLANRGNWELPGLVSVLYGHCELSDIRVDANTPDAENLLYLRRNNEMKNKSF